jgi:hypothetical protein
MNEQERKQWILALLKHSLQRLALPASEQVQLLPDFVVKTDELMLDFDHWRECAVGNYHADMTAAQLDSLATVDAHTDVPNSTGDRTVWEESALYSHSFLEELRNLAIQSRNTFGWPQETPPSYAHQYLPGRRQ